MAFISVPPWCIVGIYVADCLGKGFAVSSAPSPADVKWFDCVPRDISSFAGLEAELCAAKKTER